MKIYNRYIVITALLLLLTTVILTAMGQNSLDVYFTIYIIEALIVTELYVHFNAKARRGLTSVSIMLFAGFLLFVCMKIINVLA